MNYQPDMLSVTVKMILFLVIAAAAVFALLYLYRTLLKKKGHETKSNLITVLESAYIGVKKKIFLVEVPGALLVLAVSGEAIHLLTKIENQEIIDSVSKQVTEKPLPSFFDQFQQYLVGMKDNKG